MNKYSLNSDCQQTVAAIARVARNLWKREWAERNGGNISVDVTDLVEIENVRRFPAVSFTIAQSKLAGRTFFVKIGGARMCDLAENPEQNLLLINIDKNLKGYHIIWGGRDENCRPTSEFISHLKIHQFLRRNKMKQNVFLHTHPTHLIALSHIAAFNDEKRLNGLLFAMHPEVKINIPEGVGFVPYRCPGSESLADVTVTALQDHRVVLWEKHGCAAVAKDALEAFDLIDIANKASQIFFICKNAGFTPEGLNSKQLAEIDSKFNCK
ncbi:MAG: rhamnulose-1-phosphate aldolase [Dehalococcoidales bacterium]|nr:rhamnulose-1-phosphate aldolase [Dehalococcoidales bacterium]